MVITQMGGIIRPSGFGGIKLQSIINGVRVTYCEDITEREAEEYANEEIKLWADNGKELSSIFITVDGGEVVIEGKEKSPIRRIRRITGYLSEITNFNDGKRNELVDRRNHDEQEYNYPSEREKFLKSML